MYRFFYKLFLLITILILSNADLLAQYTWTKYPGNPVMSGSGNNTWDKHVFGACVFFNADSNRYEMFYSGSYGPETGWTPYRIGVAYSTDKINWIKYSGNPVLAPTPGSWDSTSTDFPTVVRENGMYKMWYSTRGGDIYRIGYATSPNGLTWTKHPAPVLSPGIDEWEINGVTSPLVLKETGGYVMFYSAVNSTGTWNSIGRAVSSDGINWQKDTVHNPVLSPGSGWERWVFASSVVKVNGKYFMYYTGTQKAGGLAISTDGGLTFQKYPGNPVLSLSSSGWDNNYIETGWVILEDSVFNMWYSGSSTTGEYLWKIGLATAPLLTNMLNAGTYTVGNSGDFTDINSAFEALQTHFITGSVTLELIDNTYTAPSDSFGFKLTGPIAGAGPNSRVTIKPAPNKNVTLQGSGRNVVTLLNASYVDIDGFSTTGSTTLTIHALRNIQFDRNNAVGIHNNSDYNNIRNLVIIVDDYLRPSRGIDITGGTSQYAPDNNTVVNNFIKKAGVAIVLDSYQSAVKAKNNLIHGNRIGSETDSLISWGIQSQGTVSTIISNNHVQNIRYSIHYESPGIDSYCDNGCKIRNNVVYNIDSRNARDGGFGIEVSGDVGNPGNNNWVYNNMVYDIRASSNRVAGIQLWYTNNSKIYYNSVYLWGNGSGNSNGSAALYISHSSTNVEAKNNIFVNTRDESPYCASAIYDYSSANIISDYNNLFYETSQYNCLVRAGSMDYYTLTEWQATGKDLNSVIEMPHFISPYLHIDETVATYLEGHGTRIIGLGSDFDGDTRNAATPDIGADEFNGIAVGIEDEGTLPTEYALLQNYPNPFNPSTKISWQSPVGSHQTIKLFDVLGNEIATLVNEYKTAGRYEVEFNASSLPSGVYFYQLRAGDFVQTRKMILIK